MNQLTTSAQHKLPFLLISALTLSFSLASANEVQAINIGYWNFNDLTATPLSNANQTVYNPTSGSGTLTLGGLTSNTTSGITNFTGTTINALNTDPAGRALTIQGGTTSGTPNNGGTLTLLMNLVGFADPILTFATQRSNTGFNSNQVSYSTNGTTFTNFGSAYNPSTSFTLQTFDFSTVNALDGASTAYFRITVSGATAFSGNNRFDNIQLNATAATPVPFDFDPTLGMLAIGGVWTVRKMIKKSKSAVEK